MAEIKWIKIVTDIFDNRKVKQIEALPDADSILVIWFKLICLAGSINDGGRIYFLENVPYTDEMLATQFRRPLNTVRMALDTFRQFGMIEIIDDFLCLPSWEKYQSADKLEKIREQNRLRKRRERAKMLPSADMSRDSHATVTQGHATDKEEDKERDIDIDKESKADKPPRAPRFTPPSIDEVRAYCEERGNNVDPQRFIDFYAAKGWMVGRNKMKDWKAAVRTWEQRGNDSPRPQQQKSGGDRLLEMIRRGDFDDE